MATLIESLRMEIARLEALHGPDNSFVKDLKEQLRASQEVGEKSLYEVFRRAAVEFEPITPSRRR